MNAPEVEGSKSRQPMLQWEALDHDRGELEPYRVGRCFCRPCCFNLKCAWLVAEWATTDKQSHLGSP